MLFCLTSDLFLMNYQVTTVHIDLDILNFVRMKSHTSTYITFTQTVSGKVTADDGKVMPFHVTVVTDKDGGIGK